MGRVKEYYFDEINRMEPDEEGYHYAMYLEYLKQLEEQETKNKQNGNRRIDTTYQEYESKSEQEVTGVSEENPSNKA